jgi:hypothetical protein
LPGGVKLFTACAQKPAVDVLAEAGLQAAPARWLDDAAGVSTYLWSTPENGIHAL